MLSSKYIQSFLSKKIRKMCLLYLQLLKQLKYINNTMSNLTESNTNIFLHSWGSKYTQLIFIYNTFFKFLFLFIKHYRPMK